MLRKGTLLFYAVSGGLTSSGMLGLMMMGEGVRDVPAAALAVASGGAFLVGALFMVGVGYLGQAVYGGLWFVEEVPEGRG